MDIPIARLLRRLLGERVLAQMEDDSSETPEAKGPREEPWTKIPIDTSVIDAHPIGEEIMNRTGNGKGKMKNVYTCLKSRQEQSPFLRSQAAHVSQRYLPTWLRNANPHDAKVIPGSLSTKKKVRGGCGQEARVFCGQFSRDGSVFMTACQDQHVRLYHQKNDDWVQFKDIQARDVGWSIVDTHYSPNNKFIIYSTWSNFVHLCNVSGEELHEALDFEPSSSHNRFCLFSIKFSPDNREILGGSSDASLYLYDIELQQRILCVPGHDDDVNTVGFADSQSQLFITGSDDTTCKVWDRRLLQNKKRQKPVGVFAGHYEGVTWIDAKGDGNYFISNGKDQCCKLWDIRKMAPQGKLKDSPPSPHGRAWDYRWESYPFWSQSAKKKEEDTSLMTYRGHSVLETLIRCYFSPAATTCQRYIVTGSQCGSVHIYDILTGKIVKKLPAHHATVRDVSWHPYQPLLISSSWDNTLGRWEYKEDIGTSASTSSSCSGSSSSSVSVTSTGSTSPPTFTTIPSTSFPITIQDTKNEEEDSDEDEEREILYAIVRSLHASSAHPSTSSVASATTTSSTTTSSANDNMDTSDDTRRGRRRRRTDEDSNET